MYQEAWEICRAEQDNTDVEPTTSSDSARLAMKAFECTLRPLMTVNLGNALQTAQGILEEHSSDLKDMYLAVRICLRIRPACC